VYDADGLVLRLANEGDGSSWSLRFPEIQAFRCTTEESSHFATADLPRGGALFEVLDSEWLMLLGRGRIPYMEEAKHYVICCYDEIIEVVASSYEVKELK
jgi:hypothetical protein